MKRNHLRQFIAAESANWILLVILAYAPLRSPAQPSAPVVPLQLMLVTNGVNLVVGSMQTTGALFFQMAGDLPTLLTNPKPLFQTNSPLATSLLLPMGQAAGSTTQGFFSATYYLNESVTNFGDPENDDSDTNATMLLFTSGLPTDLTNGQPFSIAILAADSTGQPLALTGTVTFWVVSVTNGSLHPDAVINPPTAQMMNGLLQLQLTINATTSLSGYMLALSINTNSTSQGEFGAENTEPRLNQAQFIQYGFDFTGLTAQQMKAALAQLRTDNADSDEDWDAPITGGYNRVSGSFGEWRGDNNSRCHYGLDLPAPINTMVYASRGGVVSGWNTVPGIGWYVNIDHGDGWFSRYLHLDGAHILVKPGQAVERGTAIASQLYHANGWFVHLHFEARYDATQSAHWGPGQPGSAQDPAQVPDIFPIPAASSFPEIANFGLTPLSPGQNVVTLYNNFGGVGASGQGYLVTQIQDPETGNNPGPRSISFLPAGNNVPQTIAPANDVVVKPYLPVTVNGDPNEGFAKYKLTSLGTADSSDYFRYWFRWDTSQYASSPTGPRSFQIGVAGYSGLQTNFAFTFGPQILAVVPDPNISEQYDFTNVAYLGTNSSTDLTQPDQYQVAIIQSDGTTLSGVQWGSPITSYSNYGLTPVITNHLQTNGYSFELPEHTDPTGLRLCISSRLAPDIMHEAPLIYNALNPISINFVGASVNGNPTPLSPSQVAGVVTVSNWNNVAQSAASGIQGNLNRRTGGGTTTSVSWTSDNLWSIPMTEVNANYQLMKGYLDNPTHDTIVSVNDLPHATNDVYVYFNDDNNTSGTIGSYTIGSNKIYGYDTGRFAGIFVLANGTSASDPTRWEITWYLEMCRERVSR